MSWKRILVWTMCAVVFLLLFVPTTDIATPDWTVFVTDTAGRPLEGAEVTVFSQQYTLETQDTEETKTTGKTGVVHFNERRVCAIGLVRLIGAIRNLDQGVHASFGVHTNIAAHKPGYGDPSKLELFAQNERESRANESSTQNSHLMLLQCSPGYSGLGCDFPDDPSRPVLPLQR